MFERDLVAEEEGFVGGHRFHHLGDDRRRSTLHLLHEFADARHTAFTRQRKQPAFDQILLVCGQVETGMILQKLTQILIVWRGHGSLTMVSTISFKRDSVPGARSGRLPGISPRRSPCRTAS